MSAICLLQELLPSNQNNILSGLTANNDSAGGTLQSKVVSKKGPVWAALSFLKPPQVLTKSAGSCTPLMDFQMVLKKSTNTGEPGVLLGFFSFWNFPAKQVFSDFPLLSLLNMWKGSMAFSHAPNPMCLLVFSTASCRQCYVEGLWGMACKHCSMECG